MTTVKDKGYWQERARNFTPDVAPIIDGAAVSSQSDAAFDNVNPATGAVICRIGNGSAGDVDLAVRAARQAHEDGRWRSMPPLARKAVLNRLADLIMEQQDDLALMDCLEMGKTISDALGDVAVASGFFRFYAEALDKVTSPVVPSADDCLAFNLLEPVGVIGAIVPWNYPIINAGLKAAPILAAGNSLVLKPSEIASLSAIRLAALALEAGVPPGVFNVVPGLGATVGAAIAGHPDIDMVTFTGSTATGRKIMEAAARSNGKRVALECGGKSPQIVFADMADIIEDVAAEAVREAFANQGQLCVARTRLLAAREIADELTAAVARHAAQLVPGDPLDPDTRFGAIASSDQWRRIKGYIDGAIDEGAEPVLDLPALASTDGCFIPPVIFRGVTSQMKVVREEVFGPVLAVQSFDTVDEAVALANASIYGLAATAWSRDHSVLHSLMRRLDAGKVVLRSSARQSMKAAFSLSAEPFKQSGFGLELGVAAINSYSRTKAVEFVS